MGKKSTPHRKFSDEFKMDLVMRALSGEVSKYSLCVENGIETSMLYRWISTFAPDKCKEEEAVAKKGTESEEVERLRRQLRQKEVELKKEKMRADFYETMVEVAEEQFNIVIRKKAGTKL